MSRRPELRETLDRLGYTFNLPMTQEAFAHLNVLLVLPPASGSPRALTRQLISRAGGGGGGGGGDDDMTTPRASIPLAELRSRLLAPELTAHCERVSWERSGDARARGSYIGEVRSRDASPAGVCV